MDSSSSSDDRSLQMSKWMRRNDRVDFTDMCAASPPSDGFFYASHSRLETRRSSGCEQAKNIPNKSAINTKESENFPRPVTAVNYSALDMSKTGKILNMDSHELEKWAKVNITGQGEVVQYAPDDSAPAMDHHRIVPSITKVDESGHSAPLRLAERLTGTPEITPSSTPSITPACSPQVGRRIGNPFFTGDANSKQEGSWLFRPGPKTDNVMYEAKVEIQASNGAQPPTKNVRYVPKPSQLRELNFFSPTSM